MVGLHPPASSGWPELVVQATTGNATATSPVSGAVVVVEAAAPTEPGADGDVDAGPMSELPHPDTSTATDAMVATTTLTPVPFRHRRGRAAEFAVITGHVITGHRR
jgi:hypothetical protein